MWLCGVTWKGIFFLLREELRIQYIETSIEMWDFWSLGWTVGFRGPRPNLINPTGRLRIGSLASRRPPREWRPYVLMIIRTGMASTTRVRDCEKTVGDVYVNCRWPSRRLGPGRQQQVLLEITLKKSWISGGDR